MNYSYTNEDYEELDERGLPKIFSYSSDRINEIIHVENDEENHPPLNFNHVLTEFRKNIEQPIDYFCEGYLKENYLKKKYDVTQFINTVHQLRRFLFNLEEEGTLRV